MRCYRPFEFFVLWSCLKAVDGKFHVGQVSLGGPDPDDRWQYLSRFGFGVGRGTFDLRVRAINPRGTQDATIALEQHLDEDWPEVEPMHDLCQRGEKARKVTPVVVPSDGNWSETVTRYIRGVVRAHVWYFAVNDCNGSMAQVADSLRFEFHAKQEDGSEFSVEQRWAPSCNTVMLVGFTLFMANFWRQCRDFARSAGAVHAVIWTLGLAVTLQYLSGWLFTWHLSTYAYDGQGLRPVHILSDILFMVSQVLQTLLLIVIGSGYTLLQSRAHQYDVVIAICSIVVVLHVVLLVVAKLFDDQANKFHDHEGVVGWLFLVLRLALFAWFIVACNNTGKEGGLRLQSFLNTFKLAGALYFLAYPVLSLIVSLCAPYVRYPVMASGLMLMQVASNVWLTRLFLTRGTYFKVSTLSASFLPSGGHSRLD